MRREIIIDVDDENQERKEKLRSFLGNGNYRWREAEE